MNTSNIGNISMFGEILQALRLQRKINQQYLATKLDVHRNTISKWERGICLPESQTMVLELAHQLRLDAYNTQRLLEASLTAFLMHWHMPFSRNSFFTGRDAILQLLHDKLGRERITTQNQSYALSGLGGIGKTQVAIEYAYRNFSDYSAVLWVAAETRESIIASFMALVDILHLPVQAHHDQEEIVVAVHRWLNEHREWLLIFDNVEDLSLIKSLLPTACCGAILMTTRLHNLESIAEIVNLERMTTEEGVRLLLHRARLQNPNASDTSLSSQEIQACQEIVALMDGLPLALDQAGAYTKATQCGLQNYLSLFQSAQQQLLDERDKHTDHPLSVSKTFILAFEQLKQSNPIACAMLTVCAFLAPEAIPEAFFSKGAIYLGSPFEALAIDSFHFNTAIKALQIYSLIQRDATTQTVTIHRLVQTVIKGYLPETELRLWVTRVIRTMSQLFPSNEKTQNDYWKISEQLLPHAVVCIALGEQWSDDIASYVVLLCRVAIFYLACVRYQDAALLYERALRVGKLELSSEHPSIAEALHGLARLYFKQDKYQEAQALYIYVLSIRERILDAEHPLIAETLFGLGSLYQRQGQYDKAEPLYERVLQAQERAKHPHAALTLSNLASIYGQQGKYVEAEPLYERALSIQEQLLGTQHPQLAPILNNAGELYREQGKYDKAEPLFLRALQIFEQSLEPDHPKIAHPLHGLAEIYREQGKYDKAEPLFLRALQIFEQRLGQEHSLVAEPLTGLAKLYQEQEKYDQAEPLLLRALNIREQTLGSEHPEFADTLFQLASLYQAQEQMLKAIPLYQQTLTLFEQTLGRYHQKTNATRLAYHHLLHTLTHAKKTKMVEEQQAYTTSKSNGQV